MLEARLSRRVVLAGLGALGLGTLVGCGDRGGDAPQPTPAPTDGGAATAQVFRRSTRGRRTSQAAKAHAANRLYPTAAAALADPAHPGDDARVVAIDVTSAVWSALFGGGAQVVDLRRL